MSVDAAACSGLRRLVLHGNYQCGVGLRSSASKDGACGIGSMGQLGLQWPAADWSAWLDCPVRYIVERWRKQLLRLAGTTVEVMCGSGAK